jgi:glycosyltransferase involved in cell wall biosynthesis
MFHNKLSAKDSRSGFLRRVEILTEEGALNFGRKVKGRLRRLLIGGANRRPFDSYRSEAFNYAECFDATAQDIQRNHDLMVEHSGYLDLRSINWFFPDYFENPFWGGIHTALRFAAHFRKAKGVRNRFVVFGNTPQQQVVNAIKRAFPILQDEEVSVISSPSNLDGIEGADACIATYWKTAYWLLKFRPTKRKFYLIQDFESLFYPAGSINAQVDATYRFGFYGITNTQILKKIYEQDYGGRAGFFTPCVDTEIFYPRPNKEKLGEACTIFFYARPERPRNGFEIGATALRQLKRSLGGKVRIVAAGGRWNPQDFGLEGIVQNLGVLDYEATASLYRTCDVGLAMMFTRHPSYIPLELMASGCLVVSNFNPATVWLLEDCVNALLAPVASASCLCETLERAIADEQERARLTANAYALIRRSFSDWKNEMERIFSFMSNPLGRKPPNPGTV